MKSKNILMLFGVIACIQLQASESPKAISNNFSHEDFSSKNKVKKNDIDDVDFYDAQSGFEDVIPVLQSKDIEGSDQYSGYDQHFDTLYKFAKRDLYLAQQNERMFPGKVYSYENLKKYFQELFAQRKRMATIKKILSKNLIDVVNKEKFDQLMLSQDAQNKLTDLKNNRYTIYHKNVVRSMNPKLLTDYKLPYNVQLQVNDIDLQIAQLVVDELYHN